VAGVLGTTPKTAQAYMGQPLFKHFFSGKRFFCGVGQARKP
jgi:hypothetical protein